MLLVDTNVISELRRGRQADQGVVQLFGAAGREVFIPVQTIGELRQGVEKLKYRGDFPQALRLEAWFDSILKTFARRILEFDTECAQKWGVLMAPNNQNPVDKQIAAIALVYDLTVVTRNTDHFADTGVRLLNPFLADAPPSLPTI